MRPWNAVGVFCDDIRQEKAAHSLIGILPDNANVSSIPGRFPKLGIYVRIHVDANADIGPISAELSFPDGTKIPLGGFDADRVKKTQGESRAKSALTSGFILFAVAADLTVPKAGRMIVTAKIGDEEVICASLNVQLSPAPITSSATSSAQPA